jgi:tetratricopeptide (TPR) repeat protein
MLALLSAFSGRWTARSGGALKLLGHPPLKRGHILWATQEILYEVVGGHGAACFQHRTAVAHGSIAGFAAWQIADDVTIGLHLGRIYETQSRKDDAIQAYLAALNTISPDRALNDDAKETRKRLADILGGYSQVDDQLEQYRKKKPPMRTVSIPNAAGAQGIAQYTIIIDANSKVAELATTGADDPLATLNDAVRGALMPQSFPDTALKKLPRLSVLTCTTGNQPCVFTLLSARAASRLAPLD